MPAPAAGPSLRSLSDPNGVFAMSELAIVSARPARLEALAAQVGAPEPQ